MVAKNVLSAPLLQKSKRFWGLYWYYVKTAGSSSHYCSNKYRFQMYQISKTACADKCNGQWQCTSEVLPNNKVHPIVHTYYNEGQPENSYNYPESTWNQAFHSNSLVESVLILLFLQSFLRKFDLKNWSSPNSLKFGRGVHCYIFISNLMFIFPKFLSITFFWANLVPKSEVLQIIWNFGKGIHSYMLISILMLIFSKFLSFIFFEQIWYQNLKFSR